MLSALARYATLAASLLALVSAATIVNDHSKRSDVVKGKVFDRFVVVWLENTDFNSAVQDPNLKALAKQGIQLTNYFALTHPSEPNYVSSAGGDYFGMDNDNLNMVPANVSSIADLLEDKGISWGEYQEDMPSSGFPGFQFLNQKTGANDYVRKHNPLIIYNSVANVPARANQIKNFTLFNEDLAADRLPQWMFITPNMTNDGHDTNVTVAGKFVREFLTPLLKNDKFNKNTLVLLTFDENETYTDQNRVQAILLGDVIPKHLVGTDDANYYDHYSEIATIEANWNLHTLGRRDVGANVFSIVADVTGDTIRTLKTPSISQTFLNESYPGIFNSQFNNTGIPVPNVKLVQNGRTVLPLVVKTWGSPELQRCTVYDGSLEVPSSFNPPVLPSGCF